MVHVSIIIILVIITQSAGYNVGNNVVDKKRDHLDEYSTVHVSIKYRLTKKSELGHTRTARVPPMAVFHIGVPSLDKAFHIWTLAFRHWSRVFCFLSGHLSVQNGIIYEFQDLENIAK